MLCRRTSVCQMARTVHCDVLPVDMGMAGEPVPGGAQLPHCRKHGGFYPRPAMSRAEAVEAVGEGIALCRELAEDGYRLHRHRSKWALAIPPPPARWRQCCWASRGTYDRRGAGLSDEGLARKVDAICRGILCNEPDPTDTLDVLAKLGGFDIAGLCGVFLGGALDGVPVVMDGFISGVAALCAVRLCPAAAKAVFASHCSAEPAARIVLEALGKAPIITAGLHLGEGTGAVASIPLWDMALAVYGGCYSFAEGGIAPYTPNADAGDRRRGQRQKRICREPCAQDHRPRYYLATMQVWDAECAARVEKHRKMRAAKQFVNGGVSPASGQCAPACAGHRLAGRPWQPCRQRAVRPGGSRAKNAARAILHGLEALQPSAKTSSLFPTRCSAAGPTTPVTQAAICWHWRR